MKDIDVPQSGDAHSVDHKDLLVSARCKCSKPAPREEVSLAKADRPGHFLEYLGFLFLSSPTVTCASSGSKTKWPDVQNRHMGIGAFGSMTSAGKAEDWGFEHPLEKFCRPGSS